MTTFTFDQQVSLLTWLENLMDAGLTINDVIEGLENGTLTKPTTEETNSTNPNQPVSA